MKQPARSSQTSAKAFVSVEFRIRQTSPRGAAPKGIFRIENEVFDPRIPPMLVAEKWDNGPYLPMWNDALIEGTGLPRLFNQLSDPNIAGSVAQLLLTEQSIITPFLSDDAPSYYNYFGRRDETPGPSALVLIPVYDLRVDSPIVGVVSSLLEFSVLMQNPAPTNGEFIDIVIGSSCDDKEFTFRVDPILRKGLSFIGAAFTTEV
jgi:hypothetical protein